MSTPTLQPSFYRLPRRNSPSAAAIDLYTSDLFRLSREYARAITGGGNKFQIFILSALHNLVPEYKTIAPYDVTLSGYGPQWNELRRAWQQKTLDEILETIPDEPCRIVVLAGVNYRGWIEEARKLRPQWQIEVPLEGLGIGYQMQRLKRLTAAVPAEIKAAAKAEAERKRQAEHAIKVEERREQLDHVDGYCSECRLPCEAERQDDSFDHLKGTEVLYSIYSSCCGADVYEDLDLSIKTRVSDLFPPAEYEMPMEAFR